METTVVRKAVQQELHVAPTSSDLLPDLYLPLLIIYPFTISMGEIVSMTWIERGLRQTDQRLSQRYHLGTVADNDPGIVPPPGMFLDSQMFVAHYRS